MKADNLSGFFFLKLWRDVAFFMFRGLSFQNFIRSKSEPAFAIISSWSVKNRF